MSTTYIDKNGNSVYVGLENIVLRRNAKTGKITQVRNKMLVKGETCEETLKSLDALAKAYGWKAEKPEKPTKKKAKDPVSDIRKDSETLQVLKEIRDGYSRKTPEWRALHAAVGWAAEHEAREE